MPPPPALNTATQPENTQPQTEPQAINELEQIPEHVRRIYSSKLLTPSARVPPSGRGQARLRHSVHTSRVETLEGSSDPPVGGQMGLQQKQQQQQHQLQAHGGAAGRTPHLRVGAGVAAGMPRRQARHAYAYPRIALGVSKLAPDASELMCDRLSFDFRDDEAPAGVAGAPLAPEQATANRLLLRSQLAGAQNTSIAPHALRRGQRRVRSLQGTEKDLGEVFSEPSVGAHHADPAPRAGHASPPPQRAKHSSEPGYIETGASTWADGTPGDSAVRGWAQEQLWEQGEVWQLMGAAGVATPTLAERCSAPEATAASRGASAPAPQLTLAQRHVSSVTSASATSAVQLPRSMHMSARCVRRAEEDEACMPWQLGSSSSSPSQHENNSLAARASVLEHQAAAHSAGAPAVPHSAGAVLFLPFGPEHVWGVLMLLLLFVVVL